MATLQRDRRSRGGAATERGAEPAAERWLPPEGAQGANGLPLAAEGCPRDPRSASFFILDLGYFILSMYQELNQLKIQKGSGFFNQRKKFYLSPEGEKIPVETLTFPTLIFNPLGLEEANKNTCSFYRVKLDKIDDTEGLCPEVSEESVERGRRRSRRRFFDYLQCNHEFDCMVTLTVSKEQCDRTDYKAIIAKLNYWLANRVTRHGLKYILVPEYHSDGAAIHFHGFMNKAALRLVDSGHKHKGRRVYNICDYALGFSTCVKLDDTKHYAAWYCYKYITKGDEKIGGRYMLTGGKLNKPVYEFDTVDYEEACGKEYQVADTVRCKIDTHLTF